MGAIRPRLWVAAQFSVWLLAWSSSPTTGSQTGSGGKIGSGGIATP